MCLEYEITLHEEISLGVRFYGHVDPFFLRRVLESYVFQRWQSNRNAIIEEIWTKQHKRFLLFDEDILLFPVNESDHWTLVVALNKERKIVHLDSLTGQPKKALVSSIILLLVFEAVREQIFYIAEKFDLVKPFWMSSMKPLKDVPHGYKIILFYTSYFRTMPWPQTRGKEKKLTDPYGNKCRVSSCYISYSRKDFSNSNALVFHNSAMPTLKRMNSIFWRKPRSQKWVWYGGENPEKTFYSVKSYSGMFDVTITYRKDSDILDPYGYYVPISNSTNTLNAFTNKSFSAGKDRLVLWLASNCVSFRLSIVKEIAKYIQVDVYGQCQYYFNHQRRDKCSRGSKDCDGFAKRYKFYLALENFNCKDYVTEKYWRNALGRDIVPVVVAGSYNKGILIPGSYIDILDFPNAKSLARYLEYLDSNDTAYNSYFEWKKKYTFTTTTNWLCDLCELLHKNTSTEVEKSLDFGNFWGKENCHADDSYIKNVWLRSGARGNGSLKLIHFMTIVMMIFYLL